MAERQSAQASATRNSRLFSESFPPAAGHFPKQRCGNEPIHQNNLRGELKLTLFEERFHDSGKFQKVQLFRAPVRPKS